MLNRIDDDVAEELLAFYQSLLEKNIREEARYQAHVYVAMLLWRNQGERALNNISAHFQSATEVTLSLLKQSGEGNKTNKDLVNFIFPLFIAYCFGTLETRTELAHIPRTFWAPEQGGEFQTVIELLDLVRISLVRRELESESIRKFIDCNRHYATQSFYQPWVRAFAELLVAIDEKDEPAANEVFRSLCSKHEDLAISGNWNEDVESLIGLWPLTAKMMACFNGVNVSLVSQYVPPVA